MKMKKEDVCVLVDTKKKAKKVYKVLKMFNQPVNEYAKQNLKSRVLIGSKGYNYIGMEFGDWFAHTGDGKTEVSIKHLKNILAKECLKKGDIVICSLNEFDYIVEFDHANHSFIPFTGSRFLTPKGGGSVGGNEGSFTHFKRYATKKEVSRFKKYISKWSEHQNRLHMQILGQNPSDFIIATLKSMSIDDIYPYMSNKGGIFKNCKKLDPTMTLGEVFGMEVSND